MRGGHHLPTVCRESGDRRCADKAGCAGNEDCLRHWRSPESPNITPVEKVSADQSERDAKWEIGTQAIVTELPANVNPDSRLSLQHSHRHEQAPSVELRACLGGRTDAVRPDRGSTVLWSCASPIPFRVGSVLGASPTGCSRRSGYPDHRRNAERAGRPAGGRAKPRRPTRVGTVFRRRQTRVGTDARCRR